jgi:4-diphosphocytidyl-2-C-methyl-D-erythritol kinase
VPNSPHSIAARAPAKLNLQLSVGGRRPDGYHEIVTIFQAVGLFDVVTATATPGRGVSLSVEGEGFGRLPSGTENLAGQAASVLAERAGLTPDVHLHLRKAIPVAGGMGGGSADAAAALVACDTLWGLGLDRAELLTIASTLGADVPFALVGGTAVGMGTGSHLTSALASGTFHWVFALADSGLETARVYEAFDRLAEGEFPPEPRVSDDVMAALRSGDAPGLGRALDNDLARAALALRPSLQFVLAVGKEYGSLGEVVSGSGPTCAFLARDASHALDLAVALSAAGVCRSVRRADGPVGGAHLFEPESVEA